MNYASISKPEAIETAKKHEEEEYVKEHANFSLWVLTLLASVDGADTALLPASLKALESDLGCTPGMLGELVMCEGVAYALFCPLWGALADHGASRKNMLVAGALTWGCLTIVLAFVNDFALMVPLRLANGAATGLIKPVTQSLVADLAPKSSIGSMFGRIGFGSSFGATLATFICMALSTQRVLGYQGWRVILVAVGLLSLLVAVILHVFLVEKTPSWNPNGISLTRELSRLCGFLEIPTFAAITLQGMLGCVPWAALAFGGIYLQYSGMKCTHAAIVTSVMLVGIAVGNILGGAIGDALTRWNRYHGRPLCAQISVFVCCPFAILVFGSGFPGESRWLYTAVAAFLLGMFGSWTDVGANQPILLDIVPAEQRASVYGWLTCLQGASGCIFGPTLVGYLTMNVFNYKPTTKPVEELPEAVRALDEEALGHALIWVMSIPWFLCFLSYCLLHFTYERDCNRVAEHAEIAHVDSA